MPRYPSLNDRAGLQQLKGEERLQAAVRLMRQSHDLDLVRTAIGILGQTESPAWRGDLIAKYEWCEAQPGYVAMAAAISAPPLCGHCGQ